MATLLTLAQALGVEISEFFADEPRRETAIPTWTSCAKASTRCWRTWGKPPLTGMLMRPSSAACAGKQMSPVLVKVHKGQTDTFSHDSEEFVYVTQGAVELLYDGKRCALGKGDSLYFDSREAPLHQPSRVSGLLVTVNYNYRRF